MRAFLCLILLLAVVAFASYYNSALRPYWEGRLPRVASRLAESRYRDAASALVEEPKVDVEPVLVVEPGPAEPACQDSTGEIPAAADGQAE